MGNHVNSRIDRWLKLVTKLVHLLLLPRRSGFYHPGILPLVGITVAVLIAHILVSHHRGAVILVIDECLLYKVAILRSSTFIISRCQQHGRLIVGYKDRSIEKSHKVLLLRKGKLRSIEAAAAVHNLLVLISTTWFSESLRIKERIERLVTIVGE